jgi:hypothetical protein
MEITGFFSGGAPIIKKYQVSEDMANSGVPVIVPAAGGAGLRLATTTAAADMVGVTVDSQNDYQTAQQSDNSSPERLVSVCVNPDVMLRARLSGGSTEDTALSVGIVDTASTTGLDVNTQVNYTNFDEGAIFGYAGGNVYQLRRIGVGDGTDATVVVAFPVDIEVGDQFLHVPFWPADNQFVQLTTNLTQVDASVAVDTDNSNFRVLELLLKDFSENGSTTSSVILVPFDHLFAAGGSV